MTNDGERRFCPFCGHPVSPLWQHCATCGKPLALPVPAAKPDAAAVTVVSTAESPVSWNERRWNEAVLRLRLGELDQAGTLLADFVKQEPSDAEALAFLGAVRLRQHRVEEARLHLDRAALMAPDSLFVRFKLAEYWLALGVPSRALAELDEAEAVAADNLDLVAQIRAVARKIRGGMRGTILLESPELPGNLLSGMFKWRRHSPSAA